MTHRGLLCQISQIDPVMSVRRHGDITGIYTQAVIIVTSMLTGDPDGL